MSEIKIAVAYHKDSVLIKNDCLMPIQVGKAVADFELKMPGDDTGDNISAKNFAYAELTAIYWLWKNSKADVKGLFHYRRFLDLNPNSSEWDNDIYEYPLDENFSAASFLQKMQINKRRINKLLEDNLLITRKREDISEWSDHTIESHYAAVHFGEHLQSAMDIIKKDYPAYLYTASKVIHGTKSYFTNMFIMKSKQFDEYCSWMFDILAKVEKQINLYDKELAPNQTKARWAGFLGERLTGIYIQKQIDDGYKVAEFPAVVVVPKADKKWFEYNTYDASYSQAANYKKVFIGNKTKPIISVVIAAYNIEKFLEKCLESVSTQTLQNIEVIIVNDGSTDKTPEIIQKYCEKDQRFICINQENQGLGKTRNNGIAAAKGKYIHLMDGDDYMDPDFLETMVQNAENNQSDVVVSNHRGVDQDTGSHLYSSTLPHTLLGVQNVRQNPDILMIPCHVWDKIYKTSLVQKFPFTPEGGEDIFFWWRLINNAERVSVVRAVKYNYRINLNSVQTRQPYILGVFQNARRAQDYIAGKDLAVRENFEIFKRVLVGHVIYRAHRTIAGNRKFATDFLNTIQEFLTYKPLELSASAVLKKKYFYCDFEVIEKIKTVKGTSEFLRMLDLNSQGGLLLKIVRYTISLPFRKNKKKYVNKINNAAQKLVYPVKIRFLGMTLLKLKKRNNKIKAYLLGLPFLKIKKSNYIRKYSLFGLPIVSKSDIRTKVLGITVRNNQDVILQKIIENQKNPMLAQRLDELLHKVDILLEGKHHGTK